MELFLPELRFSPCQKLDSGATPRCLLFAPGQTKAWRSRHSWRQNLRLWNFALRSFSRWRSLSLFRCTFRMVCRRHIFLVRRCRTIFGPSDPFLQRWQWRGPPLPRGMHWWGSRKSRQKDNGVHSCVDCSDRCLWIWAAQQRYIRYSKCRPFLGSLREESLPGLYTTGFALTVSRLSWSVFWDWPTFA